MHRSSPRPRWIALALAALLALLGCPDDEVDDDSAATDDDDSSATDDDDDSADGWGDPGAQDPPTLDELPAFTNAAEIDLTGTAQEPGSSIRAYGTEIHETGADGASGAFSVAVVVAPGVNAFDVTATLDGLESFPASASIERCVPGDPLEQLGGDGCDGAIDLGPILDNGSLIQVSGNAAEEGDEDWYTFLAGDDVNEDIAAGGDDWAISIRFVTNESDEFAFEVYRGACDAQECPDAEVPIVEYTSTLDQTPCGTPYNDCMDDTTQFYVRVYPLSDVSYCRSYKLEIRNGS
jgi:hypothetical protein